VDLLKARLLDQAHKVPIIEIHHRAGRSAHEDGPDPVGQILYWPGLECRWTRPIWLHEIAVDWFGQ